MMSAAARWAARSASGRKRASKVNRVRGPGGGDLGLEIGQREERPAGDGDVEIVAPAGELEAGADQHVDALVGLQRAEQQDAHRAVAARGGPRLPRRAPGADGPAR